MNKWRLISICVGISIVYVVLAILRTEYYYRVEIVDKIVGEITGDLESAVLQALDEITHKQKHYLIPSYELPCCHDNHSLSSHNRAHEIHGWPRVISHISDANSYDSGIFIIKGSAYNKDSGTFDFPIRIRYGDIGETEAKLLILATRGKPITKAMLTAFHDDIDDTIYCHINNDGTMTSISGEGVPPNLPSKIQEIYNTLRSNKKIHGYTHS